MRFKPNLLHKRNSLFLAEINSQNGFPGGLRQVVGSLCRDELLFDHI